MYKSRLQELCQKRGWKLPEYQTTVGGQSHAPRFVCTVTVNGSAFSSPTEAKTSKQAQSDAAEVALAHFSPLVSLKSPVGEDASSSSTSCSSGSTPLFSGYGTSSNGSITLEEMGISQENVQLEEPKNNVSSINISIKNGEVNNDATALGDNLLVSKSSLLVYCQKTGLPVPIYECERLGPPHECRFKCKVIFNGEIYESKNIFRTLREAETDATKVVFSSLFPDGKHVDEKMYKNVLQEFCQKKGYSLPVYCTYESGDCHMRTFTSSVKIDGQTFEGEVARTKKTAEISAAKNAYNSLKTYLPNTPSYEKTVSEVEAKKYVSHGEVLSHFQENLQPKLYKTTSFGEKASMANYAQQSAIKKLLEGGLCSEGIIIHPKRIQVSVPQGTNLLSMNDNTWIVKVYKP